MKKIVLILLLCIPLTTAALDITAQNPLGAGAIAIFTFTPTEEITELSITQIQIQNNNSEKISTPLTLLKQNESYFFAANLPTDIEENIFIQVEDLRYTKNDVLQTTTTKQEFLLTEVNKLHITPQRVDIQAQSYENPTITLQITNNNENTTTIQAESTLDILNNNVEIIPGQTQQLQVKANISQSTQTQITSYVKIGEINIPITITRTGVETQVEPTEQEEIIEEEQQEIIRFIDEAQELNKIITQDQTIEGPLQIQNVGAQRISGLTTHLTNDLSEITTATLTSTTLNAEEITTINVEINKNKNIQKRYDGELQVKLDNQVVASFPLRIKLKETLTEIIEDPIIEQDEVVPVEPEEQSNFTRIIPVLVILLLIAVAAAFFYKKTKEEPDQFKAYLKRRN